MIEIVIRELLVLGIVEKEELEQMDLVLRLHSGKSWVLIDH